jgi:hypothetical protein
MENLSLLHTFTRFTPHAKDAMFLHCVSIHTLFCEYIYIHLSLY